MKTTVRRVYKGEDIRRRVVGGYQHSTAKSTGYWVEMGNEVAFISDEALARARELRAAPRCVEVEG